MLLGVERLIVDLRAICQEVEGPFDSGEMRWLTIPKCLIQGGRFAGSVVTVAIAVPKDFPQTPPGGLYVSPRIVPVADMAGLNIHNRDETAKLPGEWQYWSRPIQDWTGENGARRLLSHWNAVMFNIPNAK